MLAPGRWHPVCLSTSVASCFQPRCLIRCPRRLKECALQNRVSCPVRFFIPSLLHSPQPLHPSLPLRLFSRSRLPIPGALGSSPVCWQVPGPHFQPGAPFQALAPVSIGSLDVPEKSGQHVLSEPAPTLSLAPTPSPLSPGGLSFSSLGPTQTSS